MRVPSFVWILPFVQAVGATTFSGATRSLSTTALTTASTSRDRALAENAVPSQSTTFAFDLTPVALQFSTSLPPAYDVSQLLKTDAPTLSNDLEALKSLMRSTLIEFMLESFELQLNKEAQSAAFVPELLYGRTAMEYDLALYFRSTDQSDFSTRRLRGLPEAASPQSENAHDQTPLLAIRRMTGASGATELEFYVECVGTVSYPGVPFSSPEQEEQQRNQIQAILARWVEDSLTEDAPLLQTNLQSLDHVVADNISRFEILFGIQPGKSTYGSVEGFSSGLQSQDNRSAQQKLLLAFLILMGTAVVTGGLYVVRKRRRRPKKSSSPLSRGYPNPVDPWTDRKPSPNIATKSLPGRSGDGIDDSTLQTSDLWLQSNRPDLFSALQKVSPTKTDITTTIHDEDDPAIHSTSRQNSWERFLHRHVLARRSTDESRLSMVDDINASQSDTVDVDSRWWNKLASVLHQQHQFSHEDDDHDRKAYPFAFSDFPRSDGSPCLIYSEESGESPGRDGGNGTTSVLRKGAPPGAFSMANPAGVSEDAPDDDFSEKMERIVATRRRFYDQEHGVVKDPAQADQAARSRGIQPRRHEVESDLQEIEASMGVTSSTRGVVPKVTPSNSAHGPGTSNLLDAWDTGLIASQTSGSPQKNSTIAGPSSRGSPAARFPPAAAFKLAARNGAPLDASASPPSSLTRPPIAPRGSSVSYENKQQPHETTGAEENARSDNKTPIRRKQRSTQRQTSSRGTQARSNSSEPGDSRRANVNAEDVMTLGIAAYTKFV